MLPRILSMTVVVAFLVGCAATGPKPSEVKASFPELAADQGRIYFYRTKSIFGAAVTAEIRLSGEAVGRSTRGSFFYADRPAGNYEVASSTETEKKVTFVLEAGETKYIRTYVGLGLIVGRIIPELVNTEEAEKDMAELAYVGATK